MRARRPFGAGAALLLLFLSGFSSAGDAPFLSPSNTGLTGLFDVPTARVLPENAFRLGATSAHPYRFFFMTVSPLKGLEVSGRVTEVTTARTNTGMFAGYGNYKDKAADFKYQILPEGKYAPAVALAILDPHGTRIYAGQAIIASKQIYPFDVTVGWGNGYFGKRPLPQKAEGFRVELFQAPGEFFREAKLFGGIAFVPTEKISLLAEYSSVDHKSRTGDPALPSYFKERRPPFPVNLGLRWRPWPFAEVGASYQRRNVIGVHVATTFEIGRPWIPVYNPSYGPPGAAGVSREERIAAALSESGFSRIRIREDGMVLRVEAQNDRYFYAPAAILAALDALGEAGVPPGEEYVDVRLAENGIPTVRFATTVDALARWRNGDLPTPLFLAADRFPPDLDGTPDAPLRFRKPMRFDLKPNLQTFLNDPSGFFKYRLGMAGRATAQPWRGFSLAGGIEAYPVNTISTVNAPLSIPVRSDLPLYKKEGIALGTLLAEQIEDFRYGVMTRVAAGLLEVEYAGADAEIAVPFLDGRLLLGAGGSHVYKRAPDRPFALNRNGARNHYDTFFLNGRVSFPSRELSLDVKAGRFLAGDPGVRLQISKFVNGVVLSSWYSMTKTSVFSDPYNRGYSDKGISVTIPIRLFLGRDSRTAYEYRLSPWTRDTGQDIEHNNTLFDVIGRNTPAFIDRDRPLVYRGR